MNPLFQPVSIGRLRLRNRVVMASMHSNLGTDSGESTYRHLEYLAARARGGAGLVMTEHLVVDYPRGKNQPRCLSIAEDSMVPALAEVVDAVHAAGAAIGAQLNHAGGQTDLAKTEGVEVIGASPAQIHPWLPVPRALEKDEIPGYCDYFGRAAERAVRAGFDLVEIHAAHGYLIGNFLSGATNSRTDEYGGSVENRARFLLEVYRSVRAAVGPDFPVTCRLNIADFVPGGQTVEETLAYVRMLSDAGIDAVHFSAGINTEWSFPALTDAWPARKFVTRVKDVTDVPVIAAGKIPPEMAAQAIGDGIVDLVTFGRPFLADADWPAKVQKPSLGPVRPCIYCNECLAAIRRPAGVSCAVNPKTSREYRQGSRLRLDMGLRVHVVGGGVAGMHAACKLAEAGCHVTLSERDSELGGLVRLAARSSYWSSYAPLIDYYEDQLKRCGVEVRSGVTVGQPGDGTEPFDAVVIATGATPPPIAPPAGAADRAVAVMTVLADPEVLTGPVVVLGNSLAAVAAADLALAQGQQVTIVTEHEELIDDSERGRRGVILRDLQERGGMALTQHTTAGCEDGQLHLRRSDGTKSSVPVGTLVIAPAGSVELDWSANAPTDEPGAPQIPMIRIGDSLRRGDIPGAIRSADDVVERLAALPEFRTTQSMSQ